MKKKKESQLCVYVNVHVSAFIHPEQLHASKGIALIKKKYLVMLASLDSSAPPVSAFQVVGITGVCYHTYP